MALSLTYPFEFHVTVDAANTTREKFKLSCLRLNVKPILIDMAVDTHLMTSSRKSCDDNNSVVELKRISQGLKEDGFAVLRSKVETTLDHDSAYPIPSTQYLESHVQVNCDQDQLDQLTELAEQFSNCHRSRNAFKPDVYMLTLRDYSCNKEEFSRQISELCRILNENGFPVLESLIEFCVYDSREDLDDNWLNTNNTPQKL